MAGRNEWTNREGQLLKIRTQEVGSRKSRSLVRPGGLGMTSQKPLAAELSLSRLRLQHGHFKFNRQFFRRETGAVIARLILQIPVDFESAGRCAVRGAHVQRDGELSAVDI